MNKNDFKILGIILKFIRARKSKVCWSLDGGRALFYLKNILKYDILRIYNLKIHMDLSKIKKVYFSGIGGIGISALARIMLHLNKKVIGSDLVQSETTDKLSKEGAKIILKQESKNITKDIDLFIYSPAEESNHPERKEAKKLGIKQYSYSEFLGLISKDYNTISICGTHGKSTTTAMTGWLLEKGGIDPMVIVGSKMKTWDDNLRLGHSNVLVAESCEWKAHILEISPNVILINNIEWDHPDYFKNLNQTVSIFQKYVNKLTKNQLLIINADDKASKLIKTKSKIFSFGINNKKANLLAKNIKINSKTHTQAFDVYLFNKKIDNYSISMPGIINVYNALASISVAINFEIPSLKIKKALKDFPGIWRRFENVGKYKGATIISDYGHHPTAVRQTLQAARDFYPNHRIVLAFQPHHHSRTLSLLKDFVKCFDNADVLILEEIYAVPGREQEKEIKSINSEDLIKKIQKHNSKLKILYSKDNNEVLENINKTIKKNDVVIVMGAGAIYGVISKLK